MNKIFFCLLLTLATNANALSNFEKEKIIDAIILSLQANDLDCYDTINEEKRKASTLRIRETLAREGKEYAVTINEKNQPAIIIRKEFKNSYTGVYKVTTDDTFSTVTKVKYLVTQRIPDVLVNTGTIINPLFEKKYKDIKVLDDFCE